MPKVSIETKSKYNAQETFEKVKDFMEKDEGLRKLDPTIKVDFDASKLLVMVKGKQFKADLKVAPSDVQSLVKVEVDLPLLLTPFKGKVQETLERKLGKALA